jgi:hypothetical protein
MLHDRLKPGVGKIIVTQAADVKLIANARVKTDQLAA